MVLVVALLLGHSKNFSDDDDDDDDDDDEMHYRQLGIGLHFDGVAWRFTRLKSKYNQNCVFLAG